MAGKRNNNCQKLKIPKIFEAIQLKCDPNHPSTPPASVFITEGEPPLIQLLLTQEHLIESSAWLDHLTMLLSQKANVSYQHLGESPLHIAMQLSCSRQRRLTIIDLLIKNGAYCDFLDELDQTVDCISIGPSAQL